jgi:polysaccharide pyruvyl transferase WcaK-like protein
MHVRIAVHGSYFADNFGDTLLVKLLCDRFSRVVGPDNVWLAAPGLAREQEAIGYPVVPRTEASRITHVAFSGGGYLGEQPGGLSQRVRWSLRNHRRHFSWLGRFRHARMGVFGAGVGPLSLLPMRILLRRLAERSDAFLVRDRESVAYCRQYGVPDERVTQCVDYALSLSAREASEGPRRRVLLHPSGIDEPDLRHLVDALQRSQHEFRERELCLDVITDGSGSGARVQAEAQGRMLRESLPEVDVEVVPYEGHEALLARIEEAHLTVTGKLHVGICSIARGARVLSVPHHPKTLRLYQQLGLEEFCFPNGLGELDTSALLDRLFVRPFAPDWSSIRSGIQRLDEAIEAFARSEPRTR